MKLHPACRLACLIGLLASPSPASAQSALIRDLLYDLRFVEREEAAAKAIRLKWISEERTRIREELTKYEDELTELRRKASPIPSSPASSPPPPPRPRSGRRPTSTSGRRRMIHNAMWPS